MRVEENRKRILIVDDSPQNVEALRSMLEGKYAVYMAKNGKAALRIMGKMQPDLVLLDVVMPDMDGFEVMRRIRENPAYNNIPVIFVTSDTDSFSEARGLMLGAADYIAKPYNSDIVGIKVKNQLENKLYRDNLEHLVEQRTEELLLSQSAIIMGMSLLAEGRDLGTGEHLQRIQKYVDLLGREVHRVHPAMLSVSEWKRITMLCPLHDIGKIMVSDSILLKPGQLTEEEENIIKEHTQNGADVLRKTQLFLPGGVDILEDAAVIAECHHERFDGSGYPRGLRGEEIPVAARIVALADVYDALTSERKYKEAFVHERAVDIILYGDGRTSPGHFDPLILELFKGVAAEFAKVLC